MSAFPSLSPRSLSLFFSFFFFFIFFTFLSFSLLLYLFFFKAKSSYSPTTHTEKLIPMLKSSYSLIYWREKLRDHRRQSSITHRKDSPRAHSPHRCYCTCSSIWPERRNRHPQQRRISVGNDSIWKLCCRRWEQLRWKLFYLGLVISRFFFFFWFGGVWSLGNCECSFCDCGVWSLWLICEWSFCIKLWLW